MNPLQKNKVDIKSLSPEEQRLFRLYGKLPSRNDHLAKHLKERKYFDSGDYALSKAGKADSVDTGSVGSQHPNPEDIPHLSSPVGSGSGGGGNGNGGNSVGIGGLGQQHHLPLHHHHGSMQAGSPVKESSFLNQETTAEELEGQDGGAAAAAAAGPSAGTPSKQAAIPIRR
ncbi:camp-regulated phosphoprotein/endosulfine conserved region-domain-containing protein [Phialemonium atrogriseum]|uniref:mRNA stability protein n=1 Tax=Phialemonium atrogriseum TaxID=1093897 RepID=A0AAJ0BQ40_9PEZI|nr:camp-regulated phosphoprotein/endosulfine conserved region-domain-containing protein [Phialemonium atrogriseum]KAK1762398.1 camp-regulated phosphoprotein/endosulfine conserved region-domain-containing protein [Phialemonium atrogriseum]